MERAISYLKVMPETLSEIENFADQIVSGLEIREALPLLPRLTALEKLAKYIKDKIKDQLIEEASLYSGEGKSFTIDGNRFTLSEGRKTYHYQHCEKWRTLKDQIEKLEKMMQAGQEFADPDTGEIIKPANVSWSEPFISVNLKK